jgi:hypothetical protein
MENASKEKILYAEHQKKKDGKKVAKNKSEKRGNNHRLKKLHINYCLDLSNISNEAWKEKWKNKIKQRYRLLHPTKERETIYKRISSLYPKVDLKQFEEVINLDNTPIEFMDHSAAFRETLSFNQYCTGSKGGYELAANIQLSGKNLDYQSNSGCNTEGNFVSLFKSEQLCR